MIDNYIQLLGILIPVIAALLAAFWKLLNKADENKSKYQQDVLTVRGTVLSGDIVPRLIKIIEEVVTEKELNQTESIEHIIGRTTHGHSLQQIVKRINELNDLDILFVKTISLCFACAYDTLLTALLVGTYVLWLFIDQYWNYFIPVVLFAGTIVLAKLIYDVLRYTRNIHGFIRKHNEMQLGRSEA